MISETLKDFDIVLASGSPRRRELLALLDIPFRVDTSHTVDEILPAGLTPEETAPYLARLKAMAYPMEKDSNLLVITADTVVIAGGKVLGKPADAAGARAMLRDLSGRKHKVVTGVVVMTSRVMKDFSCESVVEFAPLTDDEIDYYVDRYHPLDKAGAYGIQEWIGAAAILGIEGSFYNVMGLPVQRLYSTLKSISATPCCTV